MFRSILRMNVATATTAKTAASRAMSAATGKAYPAATAETLDKMGFASNLWLTLDQVTVACWAMGGNTRGFNTPQVGLLDFHTYRVRSPGRVNNTVAVPFGMSDSGALPNNRLQLLHSF